MIGIQSHIRLIQKTLLFFFIALLPSFTYAQVFDMVVDGAGRGTHTTLQSAIDAVMANKSERTLIFIRNGTYQEKVVIASSKINISLVGESTNGVVITWDDYSGKNGLSTANSYTLWVDGRDFYAENITVQNTAGSVAQAVALRSTGDKGVYKNCHFIGFQDTYYAHKNRQYMNGCFIEGATDFIFGDATAVFDNCIINCVKGGQYITAPADTKLTSTIGTKKFFHGLLFKNCDVTANADVPANSYSLGRPWQPDASSVFVKCRLGNHIRATGWSTWSGNNHLSGFYGEYENTDFDGKPIDISLRVSWSKQISSDDYAKYYNLDYFLRKDWIVWKASDMVKTLRTPANIDYNNQKINWLPVIEAVGYAVFHADTLLGFTKETSFDASDLVLDKLSVKSVRDNGALSTPENGNVLSASSWNQSQSKPLLKFEKNNIEADRLVSFEIFDVAGKKHKYISNQYNLNLRALPLGTYIIKATEANGAFSVLKINL